MRAWSAGGAVMVNHIKALEKALRAVLEPADEAGWLDGDQPGCSWCQLIEGHESRCAFVEAHDLLGKEVTS